MCVPLKALFLVSIISNTEINIYFFKCTNLKVVYHISLIVFIIGKAQFRRAMLSCDSSCLLLEIGQSLVSIDSCLKDFDLILPGC